MTENKYQAKFKDEQKPEYQLSVKVNGELTGETIPLSEMFKRMKVVNHWEVPIKQDR
jgi:hypothetical protein